MSHRVVRVLLIADRDVFVAQCVDFDLAAQGPTSGVAIHRLRRLMSVQEHLDREAGRPPLEEIPPPPSWFADCYNEAGPGDFVAGDFEIPPPWVVKARFVGASACTNPNA